MKTNRCPRGRVGGKLGPDQGGRQLRTALEQGLDQFGTDRGFTGLIGSLQSLGQMPFDLEGGPQPAGQQIDRFGTNDRIGTLRMRRAG